MGAKKLNYSVCIDAVFRESKLSFVEAMSVIHRLGYKAYEFWSWKDKDIKRIKEVQKETGLKTAAFCTEFINPGDPEKQQEFLEGLKRSMETAKYVREENHSLTAPILTPFTKYFCRKGYSAMKGRIAHTIAA